MTPLSMGLVKKKTRDQQYSSYCPLCTETYACFSRHIVESSVAYEHGG
jgi:hypothetical protein